MKMKMWTKMKQLVRSERGDFIQNALWIVLIVLAMIPLFGTLRGALATAFQSIIRAVQSL